LVLNPDASSSHYEELSILSLLGKQVSKLPRKKIPTI
jgi:hypothetical protein